MPKRFSRTARPKDVNQLAHHLVQLSTAEAEPQEAIIAPLVPNIADISRVMAEMGRRGGQIGGKRRLETMTKAERRKVATKAAKARWKKTKKL
jgi:hypothetical protein